MMRATTRSRFGFLAVLALVWVVLALSPTSPAAAVGPGSDPVLEWANSAGGTTGDFGASVAVDAAGNTYVTGRFRGTATFGTTSLTSGGSDDVFVAKYDSAGVLVWAISAGGTGFDVGRSVAVDATGNAYITGYFSGTVDFDPGPATVNLTSASSSSDVFVAKYDSAGDLVWANRAGGTSFDQGFSVAVDAVGNAYITGYFSGTVDFDPGPATVNLTAAGFSAVFVAKYDSAGDLVWAISAGGAGGDQGFSVAVDAAGNTYITGSFEGTADFDPGTATVNLTSAGSVDVFVAKYDSAGVLVWAISAGGTGLDSGGSVAVDAAGNAYVTGGFSGTVDFDPGPATVNLTSAGSVDVFVAKYDSAGVLVWAISAGGPNFDQGESVAVDAAGNSYITGYFSGTADFDPGPATVNLTSAGGGSDVFVAKYVVVDVDGDGFDGPLGVAPFDCDDNNLNIYPGAPEVLNSIDENCMNDAPVAVDDSVVVPFNGVAVAVSVLGNDTDVDGDSLSVTGVGAASNGTAALAGGAVTYTPTVGYAGTDSFTYDIADGNGGTDTATVDVTVSSSPVTITTATITCRSPRNGQAIIRADVADTTGASAVLRVVGGATNATSATSTGSTSHVFGGLVANNTYTLTVEDTAGTIWATTTLGPINCNPAPTPPPPPAPPAPPVPVPVGSGLKCRGFAVTVNLGAGQTPTNGDDVILGTSGPDVIRGLGGDDIICGLGSDDTIYGGKGNDRIWGGWGHDTIRGGEGDDWLRGMRGDDKIFGQAGDDRVFGRVGKDILWGGQNDDQVFGGPGRDMLGLGAGDDFAAGGKQNDTIRGAAGNDIIRGGEGNDKLFGQKGDDKLFGNEGDDKLKGNTGTDTCKGGQDVDTIHPTCEN